MPEQHKRASLLDHGEHVQSSSKKPRAQALVKQERLEGGRRGGGELEEGEVGQSGGAGALVTTAMEAMDVPQLNNLRMALTLFHCRACLLPLKPPTFKCEAGHVVCGSCCDSHGQACGGGAVYAACAEVDAFVRDAKVPCAFAEHGCTSYVVYYQAADNERSCPWAPCYCPDPGCDAFSSPARLLDHFRAAHPSWPVTDVAYGKPCRIAVPPPPHGLHVLAGVADRSVFLVTSSALGPATLVSVVCARANGDAAAKFRCTLWAEGPRGGGNVASLTFVVASSDLSGGVAAAEQEDFLAVTARMMREASGEALGLMVRIDKAGRAAGNSSPTSAAGSSGRQLVVTA